MPLIEDNSPEMSLDDPRIQAILNPDATKPAVKSDVKPVEKGSSPSLEPKDEPEASDETPDQLKAQIKGLQAELSRRKGNSEKVDTLEKELNDLKTQLKASSESKTEFAWIQQLDDDALASKQTDWDDELADARAKYGRAEEADDARAMEQHGRRILTAKKTLAAFRKESLSRVGRRHAEAEQASREVSSIKDEITEIREIVTEAYPDLLDENTALWKAGDKEYQSYPALMRQLGPLGEIVAAAMAIVKMPAAEGKKGTAAARKEVLGTLEKAVKKGLSTGASAPSSPPSIALNVDSAEGLDTFNKMIDKIKGG